MAGERYPEVLAELSKGVLRKKISQLRQALQGRFKEHHGLLIWLSFDHQAGRERRCVVRGQRERGGRPFRAGRIRLDTITGVGKRAAECHRRDRCRHEPLPNRPPPGVIGCDYFARRGDTAGHQERQVRQVQDVGYAENLRKVA